MSIYLIGAIALLAGFVGTGFVWFGWSALENMIAMRAASKTAEANDAPSESAEA